MQVQFTTKFTIKELDNGWQWPDFKSDDDGVCFCAEELEIPQEYLEKVIVLHNRLQVKLLKDRQYIREDWYVNLSRISA